MNFIIILIQKTTTDFISTGGDIATIVMAITSVLVYYGINAYLETEKHKSAAELKARCANYVDDIKEISNKPQLYEYYGYHPGNTPEYNEQRTSYKERPSQLLHNHAHELYKKSLELIYKIGVHEDELSKLIQQLKTIGLQLASLIYAEHHPSGEAIKKQVKSLDELINDANHILTKIKDILKNV